MLQLTEISRSVINGPSSDIHDILNEYFARSIWTIFTFPSLNEILKRIKEAPSLTDISRYLLLKLASAIWNSIESVFQSTKIFCLEDVEVSKIVRIFS